MFVFLRERFRFCLLYTSDAADDKALAILKFTHKAACEPVSKVLKSAIANAENNFNMDVSRLVVSEAHVAPGPVLKRIQPRAQGRAYRINKRTSHITLVLKEMED